MHYFDNFRLLKQCYFDEKYSGRKKLQFFCPVRQIA